MHIRDHARAEGWFRKHAAAPSSVGSWKAFVARNKRAQEPRTMAQEPRMGFAGGRKVTIGPNTGKYFYWIGKGDNYRTHYADSPTDGEEWVTQNRKKKGWTKKQGSKITMTEKNKGAQSMLKKNYNQLNAKEQKQVYDNIYGSFKTKTDKPGKFKVKTQASELSATDQAKILKAYPDAKFTKRNTYGFSPDHPQYDEVWRFVERDFKAPYEGGMFKKLPKYAQEELKEAFKEIDFNFDRKIEFSGEGSQFSRYGISTKHPKYNKVARYFDEPKQFRYIFDLKSPEGWMMSQMDRAALQGNTDYKVILQKPNKPISQTNKIIGIETGGEKYNMKTIVNHADFDNTKKYWNIADKTSKKYLNEFDNLAKLLPEGFDPKKIQLNDLLQFIGDKDGVKGLNRARRSIQIHHEYGVGPRATKNYQLLRQDLNILANKANNLIKTGDLKKIEKGAAKALADDSYRLVVDDVRYGPKKVSETGDIKKIISQAESELKKFTKKDFKTFEKQLIKLGCGMYAGGRVGFAVGSGKCIIRATQKLKSGNLSSAEKKIVDAMGDGLKKGGMPKKFWTTALKGEGYFALADFANNLTKGQSLDKSFSNAIETATFGVIDLGGNERDLMKYAEERGLDTKDMKEWMDYAQTYGKYVKGHEDKALREKIVEASGGEEEYWKNFQPNTILNPSADFSDPSLWDAENKIKKAEKQLEEQGEAESIQSGKGYRDMNEMIEGVVAKEWNKPAGVPGLDRGYRKMLGMKGDEGLVWGPIGSAFRESMEKIGFDEHKALKSFTPQTVMNYHPVYGYKEDIKDVIRQGDSPMEDMLYYMEKNYPGSGLIQEALREVAKEKEVEKWVDTGFGREKRKVKTDMGSYDYDPNLLATGGIASLKKK